MFNSSRKRHKLWPTQTSIWHRFFKSAQKADWGHCIHVLQHFVITLLSQPNSLVQFLLLITLHARYTIRLSVYLFLF